LELEDKAFETFAPVLERLGMDEWLVGVAVEGNQQFAASPMHASLVSTTG
jgi:hypothetical protein